MAEPPPAPLSEKALMVFLVALGVHAIVKSHKNWVGCISADEIERQRMKKTNSLIFQGVDEGIRLACKKPERGIYVEEKRFDPVALPEEPNLVWHNHARELFELWNPTSKFKIDGEFSWDTLNKCWIGKDKSYSRRLVLFCIMERPDQREIQEFERHVEKVFNGEDCSIYVIFRNCDGVICGDAIKAENGKIVIISEEYLYQSIVDFSDYFSDIKYRVENEQFPSTETVLRDIYTASDVSYDSAGSNIAHNDLLEYLGSWSAKPAGQQVAILGEYGQGKSTAALMFVYESIKNNNFRSHGRIPILLELRGKSPANLSTHELLASWGQRYDIHASSLMKLLISGRLILILEGFDEMSNVSNTESRLAHFRALWRLAYPKNKMIFTGRKNLFFEDRELQIVFKDSDVNSSAGRCETLYLNPFSLDKIERSLRWIDVQKRREILIAARSSKQIREVLSRPSLLFIVANLWGELRILFDEGRITSAVVIDKFIIHSYERQQLKEKELNFMMLTTTERRYFHEGIAVYMARRELTNQITNLDLRACLERLYKAYPNGANISDGVSMETSRPPLKIRMPDPEEAMQAIMTDVRTHGILVNDLGQRDTFRFAHKSFYELLVAKVHAYDLLNLEPVFYHSIREANDGSTEYAGSGAEILKFYSELIFMKMEKKSNPTDTALLIYDLMSKISEYKNPLIRLCMRWMQIFYLRLACNAKLTNGVFVAAQVFLVGSVLWKTSVVSHFMESYSFLSKYKYIEAATDGTVSVLGVMGMIGMVLVIVVISHMFTLVSRRASLWAAVLLANDRSMNVNNGERSIIKLLGRTSALDLLAKTKIRYHL